jgi:ectoine hydroxylase
VGVVDAQHDGATTSYPLWTIPNDTITRLVAHGGIVAPKGPPGSMMPWRDGTPAAALQPALAA